MATSCKLRYLVTGIADRYVPATAIDLCEEIQEVLSYPGPVSVFPTDDGLEVGIEVTDIEPFTPDSFEPYIYEHVLWHAVHACCRMEGDRMEFKLESARYDA